MVNVSIEIYPALVWFKDQKIMKFDPSEQNTLTKPHVQGKLLEGAAQVSNS